MSPEVAASIVARVPCPRCKAEPGQRCTRSTPHQARVEADLFTPHRPTEAL